MLQRIDSKPIMRNVKSDRNLKQKLTWVFRAAINRVILKKIYYELYRNHILIMFIKKIKTVLPSLAIRFEEKCYMISYIGYSFTLSPTYHVAP